MPTSDPIAITFTDAYEQLKQITEKLNGTDTIPPDELVELLKRGKGLELVLRAHLDEVEQQVSKIESGDSYTAYRIVPSAPDTTGEQPGTPSTAARTAPAGDIPVDTGDFVSASGGATDDDIPF